MNAEIRIGAPLTLGDGQFDCLCERLAVGGKSGMLNDRGRASKDSRARRRREAVGYLAAAGLQNHVRVRVDAAGKQVTARGIHHFGAAAVERAANRGDLLAIDEQVAAERALRRPDYSILYQYCHNISLRSSPVRLS